MHVANEGFYNYLNMEKLKVFSKKLAISAIIVGGVLFGIDSNAQESFPDWSCVTVAIGTTICDHPDGRTYGYHDSTSNDDGSCGGIPGGCRILF